MYAPFYWITIDKNDIDNLLDNPFVIHISIIDLTHIQDLGPIECVEDSQDCDNTPPPPPPTPTTYDSEPFDTVNAGYARANGFYGDGIKVGIIDMGLVDATLQQFDYGQVISHPIGSYTTSSHATLAALIIAGDEGVARDASIYSVSLELNDGISQEIDWMIGENIKIINISLSLPNHCSVTYDSIYTHYLDYVSRAYFLTIVKSAGNNNCDDSSIPNYSVTSPGLGSNIITVGGTSNNGNSIYVNSNYIEDTNTLIDKPNLVAPAGAYSFTDFPTQISSVGTSYSTPMVTGAIAVLVNKYPDLLSKPHSILSILTATSVHDNLSYNGSLKFSGLYEKTGAGILNIQNLLNFESNCEWTFLQNNTISMSYVNFVEGDKVKIANTWLRNQDISDNISDSRFGVTVYRNNFIVETKTVSYGNVNLIEFEAQETGEYVIIVNSYIYLPGLYSSVLGSQTIVKE